MRPLARFVLIVIIGLILAALVWYFIRMIALPEPFGTLIFALVLVGIIWYVIWSFPDPAP
jgi:hypothetical protein